VLAGLGTDEALVEAPANSSIGPVDADMQAVLVFAGELTLEPDIDQNLLREVPPGRRASSCNFASL